MKFRQPFFPQILEKASLSRAEGFKNNRLVIRAILGVVILLSLAGTLLAVNKKKPLEVKVKSGVHIHSDRITVKMLRDLPVPSSSENYVLLQSFDKLTNVVIGNFAQGEKIVTLISDEDGDEEVDYIIHYFFETNKYTKEAQPRSIYTKDAFVALKKEIINGTKSADIYPNEEGAIFIRRLISSKSEKMDLIKTRQGYTVKVTDVDDRSLTRLLFMYSDNGVNGVDLVFFVAYSNVYETRVQPIIQYCVYCQNSFDPTVKATVTELLNLTAEKYGNDK